MKKKDDEFNYEIPNWEKYNPRNDYKSIPWIRLDVGIFDDARVMRLSTLSKLLYIHLLTLYGQSTDGLQTANIRLLAVKLHSRADRILASVDELELNQLVKIHSRTRGVRYDTIRNDTKRNERYVILHTSEEKKSEKLNGAKKDPTIVSADTSAAPQPPVKNLTHWLIDLWNENSDKLPKARTPISPTRLKKIQTRIKAVPEKETWLEAIKKLAESNFCNGLNNTSWVADFDFLIAPTSLDKILEGKYDNRKKLDPKTVTAVEQWQRIQQGDL